MAGVQCCLPGVGQGENRLTFPTHYLVRDALDREWIRFATDDERREGENKWWRRLDFTPQCIVHMNQTVAHSDDPIGLVGLEVTVLAQEPEKPQCYDKPLIDVTEVPTPPTPPPSAT